MSKFDEDILKIEYENHSNEKQKYVDDIKQIVISLNVPIEGNLFYVHNSLNTHPDLYIKQLHIFWCGKQASKKMCEIGFNAGHSTMLMLLGREKTPLDFTIFDIGHHSYTVPCLKYIESQFQHIRFEYIEGDSTVTIPKWMEENSNHIGLYDVVHVDGGHSEYCISNDMKNADRLVIKGGLLIIDDTDMGHINKYVDSYLMDGKYIEISILNTITYRHRIIQKIM